MPRSLTTNSVAKVQPRVDERLANVASFGTSSTEKDIGACAASNYGGRLHGHSSNMGETMKRFFLLVVSTITVTAATLDVRVIPTLAPDAYFSPSFSDWQANTMSALITGRTHSGDSSSPTYYGVIASAPASWAVVTGFPSWNGFADPGTQFGDAYAEEYGRRITFGVVVEGDGTEQFSISELSFSATSDDLGHLLTIDYTAGSYGYSSAYRGLSYGADRIRGTADDVWIKDGPSTQLVDAIFGRGSGISFTAYCSGPCTIDEQQAAIAAVGYGPYTVTGQYSIAGVSGAATFTAQPVPEPGSTTFALVALAMVSIYRLRNVAQRHPRS